ncbi:hypothetical protein P8452_58240 [Trifolium repens]|nr:hypothetical protein QL285_084184 [Trifolium repens]WJX74610.1 hypothetical protein P8452_58240 [Trifolium repens]
MNQPPPKAQTRIVSGFQIDSQPIFFNILVSADNLIFQVISVSFLFQIPDFLQTHFNPFLFRAFCIILKFLHLSLDKPSNDEAPNVTAVKAKRFVDYLATLALNEVFMPHDYYIR